MRRDLELHRASTILIVLATIACACRVRSSDSGETGIVLAPASKENIAAGASLDVALVDACSDARTRVMGTGGKIPSRITVDFQRQTCEFTEIDEVVSAASDDDAVLEVAGVEMRDDWAVLNLTAKSPGNADVEVTAETSTGEHTTTGSFRVWPTNRLEVVAQCRTPRSLHQGERLLALRGESLGLRVRLFHDRLELTGYGYLPLEFSGLQVVGTTADLTTVSFDELGEFSISSAVDSTVGATIEVVEPGQIRTLGLRHDSTTCQGTLRFAPSVDELANVCVGVLPVHLEIQTPDVCAFSEDGVTELTTSQMVYDPENPGGRQVVYARGPGVCRVAGTLVDTELTETIEIPFDDCQAWPREEIVASKLVPLATGETLVFAPGGNAFLHDGVSVTEVSELEDVPQLVTVAWADALDSVIALRAHLLVQWRDGVRTEFAGPATFRAGTSIGDEHLLVGQGAARFDGVLFEELAPGPGTYTGVWAANDSVAFVSGFLPVNPGMNQAVLTKLDGETWTPYELDYPLALSGVWGTGPSDVVAVGEHCGVLQFDGAQWSRVPLGCDAKLNAVHGSASGRIVAVGDEGTVVTRESGDWSVRWVAGAKSLSTVRVGDGYTLVGAATGLFAEPN